MERIDTWQQDRDTASFTLALQTQCATIRRGGLSTGIALQSKW